MIRSSTLSMKFTNKNKRLYIEQFIDEYRTVVAQFIDILWDQKGVSKFLSKEIIQQVESQLPAAMIQCAGEQALRIVRRAIARQKRRFAQESKVINEVYIKPSTRNVYPELDNRFITIDLQSGAFFDGWVSLSSADNKLMVSIPFKKTRRFNKLLKQGKLNNRVKISNKQIIFMFDILDIKKEDCISIEP